MRPRILLLGFVLLPGCTHLPLKFPLQIKAAIEGEIKGKRIHCEKTLDLGQGQWGVMCEIGNGMDIKYRINPFSADQTKVEFLVAKEKEGGQKIIAAPALIVKGSHSAQNTTTTENTNIIIKAEHAK